MTSDASRSYPVTFDVNYPDRELNRLTTAFRLFTAIPIALLLATLTGFSFNTGHVEEGATVVVQAGGLLVVPPLLMIVFRQRYPDWWFDWNVAFLRFTNRVSVYLALMDDRYPSTTDPQSVRLELARPDVERDLNRWMPLVKWFLAIPHYLVLLMLTVASVFAIVAAWFAILFTGRYPRGLFDFVEGVMRWQVRVVGYAFVMVTDEYPPFRLGA